MGKTINTVNKFMIGTQGDSYLFLRPVPQRISKDDALVLAAYIVAMNCNEEEWQAVYQAVLDA